RELTALTAAVLDWTDHWNSAEGEAFLPLLAHVLGVRFEIFRADRYGEGAGPLDFRRHQAVGPADAPRTVELFHTTSYTRRSVTENGETTTRWVPTGDQRYAGSTAVEPVTDTPPESAPTPTRAAQDPRLAPVPEPAPARTWSDLRELADEVIAHGPVAISALGPCAGLARRLTDRLFPGGGVRPGVPLDDLTSSRSATEFALAPGPGWASVRSWDVVADALRGSAPGTLAVVLAGNQGGLPGHAWAAYRLPDTDVRGVAWVNLTPGREGQPVSDGPPALVPLDARAVLVDPSGRVRPNALPLSPGSTPSADAWQA
ncbi:hypothetical protein AN220_13390, partial [Streptomyces nanshensis]